MWLQGNSRKLNERVDLAGLVHVIGLNPEAVEKRAVLLRRSMRLKLPDAIIYATALSTGRRLITADRRDFPDGTPEVDLLDLTL